MKRNWLFFTAIIVVMCMLCACGGNEVATTIADETVEVPVTTEALVVTTEAPVVTTKAPVITTEAPVAAVADCKVEIVSCTFEDEVLPRDFEFVEGYYPANDDKVYVDLVLYVTGGTSGQYDGYFMYGDLRYDMQVEKEKYTLTDFEEKFSFSGGQQKSDNLYVHLFQSVDKAAMNEDITVKFTVNGNEYECKVDKSAKKTLDQKTELKLGDKVSANGEYDIEVVSCGVVEYLSPYSDKENGEQYYYNNSDAFDVVVKIKNNNNFNLQEILAYTVVDDAPMIIDCKKEDVELASISNKIGLVELGILDYIRAGEEAYVHFCMPVSDIDVSDLAIRFNLGGICYYVKAK